MGEKRKKGFSLLRKNVIYFNDTGSLSFFFFIYQQNPIVSSSFFWEIWKAFDGERWYLFSYIYIYRGRGERTAKLEIEGEASCECCKVCKVVKGGLACLPACPALPSLASFIYFSKMVGLITHTMTMLEMIRVAEMTVTKKMLPLLAGNFPRMIQYYNWREKK